MMRTNLMPQTPASAGDLPLGGAGFSLPIRAKLGRIFLRASASPRQILLLAILATPAFPQAVDLTPVVAKLVSRTVDLPGEFQPFLSVSLHAKVPGYVEKVLVDRGSVVKQGQLLAELSAPEMAAHIAEAESKVQAAEIRPPAGRSATRRRAEHLRRTQEGRGNARRHRRQRTGADRRETGRRRRAP